MTTWKPISESRIRSFIGEDALAFSNDEKEFFESIRIPLQKWDLDKWGDYGEGFWVVAKIEKTVLWYNDIEEGFNYSTYSVLGKIDEYWCDQDDLALAVRRLHNYIRTGETGDRCGPPVPIV